MPQQITSLVPSYRLWERFNKRDETLKVGKRDSISSFIDTPFNTLLPIGSNYVVAIKQKQTENKHIILKPAFESNSISFGQNLYRRLIKLLAQLQSAIPSLQISVYDANKTQTYHGKSRPVLP